MTQLKQVVFWIYRIFICKNNLFIFLIEKVVGFRLGEYKAGSNEVVEPNCLKNISKSMKSMVKVKEK